MIKDTGSANSWRIGDSSRATYNVVQPRLWANLSSAEDTTQDWIDLTSNGFKIRTTAGEVNTSSGTYIYAAFAETPFKFANAR
jgi:hypothetical protein